MARQIKTLFSKKLKSGETGYAHRDHRSKKGRKNKQFSDNGRLLKFKKEELEFGKLRHVKKMKTIKFR